MWNEFLDKMRGPELPIVKLARKSDLDQETSYTICKLIDRVGWDLKEDWDWLQNVKDDYRSMIDISLLKKAWRKLVDEEWLSLQTTNDEEKRISTILPLTGLVNLKSLVLQNNLIQDLIPVSEMTKLKYLNCYQNKISDLTPLRSLQLLEELQIAKNPVASLRVLEELPKLRELDLSIDQIPRFSECKRLAGLLSLDVSGDDAIANFIDWPEMPSLKILKVHNVQNLKGIERFESLETLEFIGVNEGKFSDLSPLSRLKRLTHLTVSSSKPLDVSQLAQLNRMRFLSANCPKVIGLAALSSLPVLHEIRMDDEASCNVEELSALRKELTPWDAEFKNEAKRFEPSLDLQIVDQETFDYYDSKAAFGIREGECYNGMLGSERNWLLGQIGDALSVNFEENRDFHLPYTSGLRRSERVIIYTTGAYESFREIALAIQRILCDIKNDWIIWFQSCLDEGPEDEEVPEEMEEFTVWIYPNKIVATKDNAKIVRKLIEWQD